MAQLELVITTQAELGFEKGTTFDEMVKHARQLGLELCPAEVGPYLRLVYKDQPKGEWLRIAMEPITDSVGYLGVFCVEHDDDGLYLNTNWFNRDNVWNPDYRWVFVRNSLYFTTPFYMGFVFVFANRQSFCRSH